MTQGAGTLGHEKGRPRKGGPSDFSRKSAQTLTIRQNMALAVYFKT